MPYRSIEDPVKLRRVLEASLLLEADLDLQPTNAAPTRDTFHDRTLHIRGRRSVTPNTPADPTAVF